MAVADPPFPTTTAARPGAGDHMRRQRGITIAPQVRLDAGLMRGRLPWPVAVYMLCMVLPVWFHAGPLYLSLLRLYLLVVIVPVVARLLMGHFGRTILTDWLFLAHTLWMAVALAITSPQQAVTQVGSMGIEFLGGYAVARAYIRTPEDFLALCRWLVFLVLLMLPLAVVETLTYRVPVIEAIRALPFFQSVELIRYEPRMGFFRAQVVFPHPILFGLFCSVVFSLAFVALKGVVPDGRRWIASALAALACFLSLSSGALLAIALQFGLIIWAALLGRLRWRWWLLVGLLVLAYVVIDLLSNRTPLHVFMSYATFSSHTAYYRAIIFDWGIDNIIGNRTTGIPASPLVGIGMNEWVRPEWMFSSSVDNFWLLIAMRYGLPGFLLLVIGYFLVVAGALRRDFSADPVLSQIRLAWVFTFFGLTFTLCTVHIWSSVYSFVFFMFGAGVWLIGVQPTTAGAVTGTSGGPGTVPDRRGTRYSRYETRPSPNHRS